MKMVAISFSVFMLLSLVSCGDSYNSRLYQGTAKANSNIGGQCKSGCYGIPQDWYDKGLIVQPNGQVITQPDLTVKIQGECYFKICESDINSPYTKDAHDWVDRYGGGIFNETDVLKCANLNFSLALPSTIYQSIDVDKDPGC